MKKLLLVFAVMAASIFAHSQVIDESFELGTVPSGWLNSSTMNGTWKFTDAFSSGLPTIMDYDGTYRAIFDTTGGPGDGAKLATDRFDLSGNFTGSATVSFAMVRNDDLTQTALLPDNLLVLIDSTDINDGLGEYPLGLINRHKLYYPSNTDPGAQWIVYTFAIPTDYKAASNRIVFQATTAGGENIMIDKVVVTVPASTLYCTPTSTTACDDVNSFYISETQLDGASLQTSTQFDCGAGGYTDYSGVFLSQQIKQNDTHTLTALTSSTGTPPAATDGRLWIDWNQDADFVDPGEEYVGVPNGANFDFTVLVPIDAMPGNTRARFMVHGLASPTDDPTACGTVEFGEYEDYTLRIGEEALLSPDCPSAHSPAADADGVCTKQPLFEWTKPAAPSVPAEGFVFWLGEMDPANNITWIYSGIDVGDTNAFQIMDTLNINARYVWNVLPYNAIGDTSNCDSLVFLTPKNIDPKIMFPDTVEVCFEQSLLLDPIILGGTRYTLNNDSMGFAWTGDSVQFLSRVDTSQTTFNGGPVGFTKYYMTVTDSLGCTDMDSVEVKVKPKATAGLAGVDQLVCYGDSAQLELSGFLGTIQWQDSTNGRVWMDVVSGIGSVSANYTSGSIIESTYFRTVVDLDGCTDTSNFVSVGEIILPADPSAYTVGGDSTLCPEDSVLLFTADLPGPGLSWILGNDTLANDTNSFMAVGPGEFRLVYSKTVGGVTCFTGEDTIPVTLISNPSQPQIQLTNGDDLCEGDSTYARVVNYIDEDAQLLWSSGEQTDSLNIKANFAGNVVYTDDLGCTSTSDSVFVNFTPIPDQPIILVQGEVPPCEGDSLLLITLNHEENVTWNVDPVVANDSMWVYESGGYVAQVVVGPGCTAESTENLIEFNPTPEKPVIEYSGDSLRTDSTFEHIWFDELGVLVGETSHLIIGPESGTYRVISINEFGCASEISDPISITGIGVNEFGEHWVAFPNPTNGIVHIKTSALPFNRVVVRTIDGKIIQDLVWDGYRMETTVQLPDAIGVYFLDIRNESGGVSNQIRVVKTP